MSALPSPLKSPILTSTQVAAVLHMPQRLKANEEPVLNPTHHCPVSLTRPTMSALPSPLKSATCTSTQVTLELQLPHLLPLVKYVPVVDDTQMLPVCRSRPTRLVCRLRYRL